MLQIDAILPLYPDDASRRLMLTQAVECIRDDISSLRQAIDNGDHDTAVQRVHRAKGTASFLGGEKPELKFFDNLTQVLKDMSQKGNASQASNSQNNALPNPLPDDKEPIQSALKPVEATLRLLEASLQQSLATHQ